MLTSDPQYRSMRGVRSFLSSLNASSTALPESFGRDEAGSQKPLKALHLSPLIQSPGQISPALWSWIHCGEPVRPELLERIPFRNEMALQRAAGLTRLFSFNGDALKVPEYLATMKEMQLSSCSSDDQLYKASLEKSSRPPLPQLSSKKNLRKAASDVYDEVALDDYLHHEVMKRFYVQVVDACVRNVQNVENVYFSVKVGHQQHQSTKHTLVKEGKKGFGMVIHPSEGFLFDVKEDEIRVTISLLTKNNNAGQAHSTLGRRASFMFFGPKRTDLSSQSADSNSSMGLTLGEVTFTFKAGVGKSSVKPFSLMSPNGKKEVAKVMIQTGLFMDQEYSHEEELLAKKEVVPEPDVAEYANFLNVMMYAKSTWRNYWAVYRDRALHLFDFEYKEEKPEIARISVSDFLQVKNPNPEYFCYSNALQVHISEAAVRENAWLGSITTTAPEDSLFNSFPTVMFLSADSKVSRDIWMDKFNELIALGEYDRECVAAAAMSAQRQKKSSTSHRLPMLPPRKRF